MEKVQLILIFVVTAYAGVCATMYFLQERLIFPAHMVDKATLNNNDNTEHLELRSTDNKITLHGIAFNPQEKTKDLVIVFSGNAQNAKLLAQDVHKSLPNATIAAFNYRGYGRSEGSPSQKAIFADTLKQIDFLIEKFEPKKTYFLGYSLGTGVISQLLSKHQVDGAFMLTPFDSVTSVAKTTYPYLPINFLIKHPFRSIKNLKNNKTPLAVITVNNDDVIPQKNIDNFIAGVSPIIFQQQLSGVNHGYLFHHKKMAETLQKAKEALEGYGKS